MLTKAPKQRIRLVFVDHTAQLGGGEIALRNLLHRLEPSRIESQVVLCSDGRLVEQLRGHCTVCVLPIGAEIGEVRKDSVGWKSLLKVNRSISAVAYILRLSRHLRRVKAQLVHTNSLKAHIIGGIAGRLAGVPVIWHMRDRIAADYLPRGAVALVRFLSKVLPCFIITNSHATLRTLVTSRANRKGVIDSARFRVIHDGCEVPMLSSSYKSGGPVKIGMIGRISPWKGQHIFIEAAAMIREEFPDVRFQIIGAPLFSETAYEANLKQLTRQLGVDAQVEFVGFVHNVQSMIAQMNIVVHASTIAEPFGQVVIEGMAAGKPVIATDGGGIPEIVVDQVTGLLVKMNDAGELAGAMAALLRDPTKAREMGMQGRARVQEAFTIERTAERVEQVYQEVLGVATGYSIPDDQAKDSYGSRNAA